MDEAAWLASRSEAKMLRFVLGGWLGRLLGRLGGSPHRGRRRKVRLLHCACCRSMWEDLFDASRAAVEASERFADGEADRRQFRTVRRKAEAVAYDDLTGDESRWRIFWGQLSAGDWGYDGRLGFVALDTDKPSDLRDWEEELQAGYEWAGVSCAWLRDIFGNPFRPVALDPAWRTPTVLALAAAAYDNRTLPAGHLDPNRLAVLADALEDVGCTNAELLEHLRGPGPHVRGCWPVDILLNNE